jgi:hypothetical protein
LLNSKTAGKTYTGMAHMGMAYMGMAYMGSLLALRLEEAFSPWIFLKSP